MQSLRTNNWIFLLLLLYFFGTIGISLPYTRDYFLPLTPVNLLYTFFIVFEFGLEKNKKALLSIFLIGIFGYTVELIGVNTSLLFGQYHYGSNFGIKIFNTPILIAINWITLTLCSYGISVYISKNKIISILIAASIMVGLDLLIEPVCHILDYWKWKNNDIPFNNYRDWFLFSILFNLLCHYWQLVLNKSVCLFVIILESLFFIILNFILR